MDNEILYKSLKKGKRGLHLFGLLYYTREHIGRLL